MSRITRADEGFTLAELMVVISILGVIVAALGTALTVSFRTAYGAAERMDRTHDGNLVATYLDPDLASASTVATSGTTCSGLTNELALSWSEEIPVPSGASTTTSYVSAYAVVADGGSYLLRRFVCTGGGSAAVNTVAHDLTGSDAVTVTVASGEVAMTVEAGTGDAAYTYTVSGVVGARTA